MKRVRVLVATVALAACSTTSTVPAGSSVNNAQVLALVAQAQARLQENEVLEGLRMFRKAVALKPDDESLAEEYGVVLASVGVDEGALEQLRRVSNPSSSGEAWLGLLLAGRAKTRADVEEAIRHLKAGLEAIPEGSRVRFELVQSLLKLGHGDEAWTALRPLFDEQPDNPRVRLMGAEALQQSGRFAEAEELLRQVIATLPESDLRVVAQRQLAEVLSELGSDTEAATLMEEVTEASGSGPRELSELARLRVRAGDTEGALRALDEALGKAPTFRGALLMKAVLEYREGNIEAAEQLYRRALAADSGDVDAALGLVRLLIDTHGMEEARALLDQLWQRAVEAEAVETPLGLEVAQEGATLELVDHATDAGRVWLDRIEEDAVSRRSLALWGEYFRLREAWTEGLDWLSRLSVEDDPGTRRLRVGLTAEFDLARGDEEEGMKVVRELAAGDEEDVLAALAALQGQDRYDDAVSFSREARTRFPESTRVQFVLAASLERAEHWDAAVEEFRALIARDADNAAALNYLGYMFADRNVNLDDALELVGKAVQLDPSSGAYQDSLGWVYYRLGDFDRAEKHLREAVRLDPHDATVLEHLGDLLHARGDGPTAASAYREALRLEPEEDGQRERLEEKLAAMGDAAP